MSILIDGILCFSPVLKKQQKLWKTGLSTLVSVRAATTAVLIELILGTTKIELATFEPGSLLMIQRRSTTLRRRSSRIKSGSGYKSGLAT